MAEGWKFAWVDELDHYIRDSRSLCGGIQIFPGCVLTENPKTTAICPDCLEMLNVEELERSEK